MWLQTISFIYIIEINERVAQSKWMRREERSKGEHGLELKLLLVSAGLKLKLIINLTPM